MVHKNAILLPLSLLAAWTMVMWAWMYFTRIPAIIKSRMRLDPNAPRGEQMNSLPPKVRWKADNYNHLMEQPTVFYAVVLALAIIGKGTLIDVSLAWIYVGSRIAHSLIQSLWNIIKIRFYVFTLGSIVLMVMIARLISFALWQGF